MSEYVENKHGIHRGFVYNFYPYILNMLFKAKSVYPKIWYLADIGILNERFLIAAGKDFVRGINALNHDRSLYHSMEEKVKELHFLSKDEKTLVEAMLLTGAGKYKGALDRLKMLKEAYFEDSMASLAASIRTISAILFNYLPEYSIGVNGTNLKEGLASNLWMALLEMLEKGREQILTNTKTL